MGKLSLFTRIQIKRWALLLLIPALIFTGCRYTKYVPENKYLLDQNILKIEGKGINKKELEPLFKQKPNKRILGFRFHLGLYNLSKLGSNRWLSRSFRKIGEEPVIYDELLKDKTTQQILLYLKNKGYYKSIVTDTAVYKIKSVRLYYKIWTGIPYKIQSLNYKIEDTAIAKLVIADSINCLLKPGTDFDIDQMQSERLRIETFLKNRGYYSFTKEYIQFEADSALGNYKVKLLLRIRRMQLKDQDGSTRFVNHSIYKLGKIKVVFEKKPLKDTIEGYMYTHMPDSVYLNNIQVLYRDGMVVKPSIIINKIYIAPGQLYNKVNVDESYKSLLSLKIFKFINIGFTEDTTSSTNEYKVIDCRIQLATNDFQSYQIEAELTNSSGLGVAGNLVYQNKNFFKGADIFSFKVNGATEAVAQTQTIKLKSTIELGVEAKIEFPKYLLPFRTEQFIRKYNPKTYFSVGYGFQRRIYYTNSIANLSFGYNWSGNSYSNFQVIPFDINYVKLIDTTSGFYTKVNSLSQKYSRTDHLVSVTSFSFIFNKQRFKKNTEFYFFRLNAETAGNTMRLLSEAFNANKDSSNTYKLFTVRFAQYVKGDVDYHYYQPVNQTDRIVYRVFIGVAYPYGNAKLVPFERQYFSGGANSIRGWKESSLGPGSYKDSSEFPDVRADIKLEGNLEYRFKLFWILEGALFVDAGNVWSINTNDNRKGALFTFDKFVSQIAVGTGFGTRFDFSYFIFRLDLGLKLRDPSLIKYPWLFNRSVNDTRPYNYLLHLSFGIGYPF